MNSIKYRFEKIAVEQPCAAAWACFRQAVEGRRYTRRAIRENFLVLVPRSDYDESCTKVLIDQLYSASNPSMEDYFGVEKEEISSPFYQRYTLGHVEQLTS